MLPNGADAFNKVAGVAWRDSQRQNEARGVNLVSSPFEHADASTLEAHCRGARPEKLLPKEVPLPPYGANDPLNAPKTQSRRRRRPSGTVP